MTRRRGPSQGRSAAHPCGGSTWVAADRHWGTPTAEERSGGEPRSARPGRENRWIEVKSGDSRIGPGSASIYDHGMVTRVRTATHRLLPSGPRDVVRQIVLFCGAYYLYRIVRGIVDDRVGVAFENARHIVHFEQGLGIFPEPSIHRFAEANEVLTDIASWLYVNSHFVVTTVTLAYIYLRRNDS